MSGGRILRRAFRWLNRFCMVPLFRLGLGPIMVNPFSGYIMLLRTTGRRSGKPRYAPVNYAILEGCIYCLAGFGEGTHWLANLRSHPQVELLLPGRALAGMAEEVDDPMERLVAVRRVLSSAGFAGYFLGFDPRRAGDAMLQERTASYPVVRIRPVGIAAGPYDAGGSFWVVAAALWIAAIAAVILAARGG